ncbi:membrane transporter, putative [Bodo saltans]|uniref:Membrane transporter, putative n=1 Tax=Bodo saltans TaxID=75058 RepID=A0A0S4IZH0_BODSA|nr:membrane transporter, putative [Bodo saltans]|eukprot:CUG20195.1 membrane transporter, putative [Bodo saltans]
MPLIETISLTTVTVLKVLMASVLGSGISFAVSEQSIKDVNFLNGNLFSPCFALSNLIATLSVDLVKQSWVMFMFAFVTLITAQSVGFLCSYACCSATWMPLATQESAVGLDGMPVRTFMWKKLKQAVTTASPKDYQPLYCITLGTINTGNFPLGLLMSLVGNISWYNTADYNKSLSIVFVYSGLWTIFIWSFGLWAVRSGAKRRNLAHQMLRCSSQEELLNIERYSTRRSAGVSNVVNDSLTQQMIDVQPATTFPSTRCEQEISDTTKRMSLTSSRTAATYGVFDCAGVALDHKKTSPTIQQQASPPKTPTSASDHKGAEKAPLIPTPTTPDLPDNNVPVAAFETNIESAAGEATMISTTMQSSCAAPSESFSSSSTMPPPPPPPRHAEIAKKISRMNLPIVGSVLGIIIALVPGLQWFFHTPPFQVVIGGIGLIGAGCVPVSLLLMGANLTAGGVKPLLKIDPRFLLVGTIAKTMVLPAINIGLFFLCDYVGLLPEDRVIRIAVWVEIISPSPVMATVICRLEDYMAECATGLLLVQYIVATFTTTMWLSIFLHLYPN